MDDDDEEESEGSGGRTADADTARWREGRALIEREVQGASGNTLGLSSRGGERAGLISPPNGRTPTPSANRYSDNPAPSLTAGSGAGATAGAGAANSGSGVRSSNWRSRAEQSRAEREARIRAEEEDGNFFTDFGARVKNTFDNVDFTFTKPKWMGGDDAGSSDRGNDPSSGFSFRREDGGNDGGNGWRSLFGGRGDEGRVRL